MKQKYKAYRNNDLLLFSLKAKQIVLTLIVFQYEIKVL